MMTLCSNINATVMMRFIPNKVSQYSRTSLSDLGLICLSLKDNTDNVKLPPKHLDLSSPCVVYGSVAVPQDPYRALRSQNYFKSSSVAVVCPSMLLMFTLMVLKEWKVELLQQVSRNQGRGTCCTRRQIHLKECPR